MYDGMHTNSQKVKVNAPKWNFAETETPNMYLSSKVTWLTAIFNLIIFVIKYYDNLAANYDDILRGWGWCVPEVGADAMERYGGFKDKVEYYHQFQNKLCTKFNMCQAT
jgi:hypothetical protein